MKKCRNCRTTNTPNSYRCINCGSSIFERKTTGIVLFIFAVYSLFSYFVVVLLPWRIQAENSGGDPSVLIFGYLLQVVFVVVSLYYSYRLWPSGYDWFMKLLGKEIPEDKSGAYRGREQEKTTSPVPVQHISRATKQCLECKAMNPEIAKFCYSCRSPFKRAQTVKETIAPPKEKKLEATDTCPNCGIEQMASEQKFCYNCGNEINE
ncbi:MAG: zinc ribbon domain-containing protein [Candidatus Heimdallarchaeota archaeon]|nr:zinc ribbon domain-containing protein [Candidatus Heimdallarchaeota archaeon]MCK5048112.1 zinc ribbon domain-containing protein [Candidatus Heimdallarchaeota archaeon]